MGSQLCVPLLDTRAYTADQFHLMKTNVLLARRKEKKKKKQYDPVRVAVSFGMRTAGQASSSVSLCVGRESKGQKVFSQKTSCVTGNQIVVIL